MRLRFTDEALETVADLSGSGRWARPARAARCCDDGRWPAGVGVDAQRLLPGAPLDDFFKPDKCAAADEQDLGDVAVGVLKQLQDDVFDVLADARFGQRGGVHDGEGHLRPDPRIRGPAAGGGRAGRPGQGRADAHQVFQDHAQPAGAHLATVTPSLVIQSA